MHGHHSKDCRQKVNCSKCQGRCVSSMCNPTWQSKKAEVAKSVNTNSLHTSTQSYLNNEVLLQIGTPGDQCYIHWQDFSILLEWSRHSQFKQTYYFRSYGNGMSLGMKIFHLTSQHNADVGTQTSRSLAALKFLTGYSYPQRLR